MEGVGQAFLVPPPLAIYFSLRSSALDHAGASSGILTGLASRLADNIYIIPRYLLTIIWPPASSIRYHVPEDLHTLALPLATAWTAIIAAIWWLTTQSRSRASLFGMAWFVAFWLPTCGIIPFPSAPMADRYLYLPAIGLWLIVADQAFRLRGSPKLNRAGLGAAIAILTVLSAYTILRNRIWKDDIALFSDYVQNYPDQAFGHHNLGTAYLDLANDLGRADLEFGKVLALDPFFPRLHTQMGYVRLLRGDFDGALLRYDEAVRQNPLDAEALLNRGTVLEKLGRYSEAIEDYKRFLAAPNRELDGARPRIQYKIIELEQGHARTDDRQGQ